MLQETVAQVGARVREARKRRGLTQRELARAAELSFSLVTKLEQGALDGIRLETVHQLATALQVTTTSLMAEPDASRQERPRADRELAGLRGAIEALSSASEPDEAPTVGGLRDVVSWAEAAVRDSHYGELATALPSILRDSDALVGASASRDAAVARQIRSTTRQIAAFLLGQAWEFDAATAAVQAALADADDEVTALSAVDWRCWLMLRQGLLSDTGRLAARYADEHRPDLTTATPAELTAWGRLQIRVSTSAARDNRPDDARESLRLARMAAAGLNRDTVTQSRAFGPVTVAMVHAENAIVQGRPDITLSVGAQIVGRDFPVPRNLLRHKLDMASAHVSTRQPRKAVAILQDVRSAAPEWMSYQRNAQDIVTRLVASRRSLTEEVRDLADFVQVPV